MLDWPQDLEGAYNKSAVGGNADGASAGAGVMTTFEVGLWAEVSPAHPAD